MYLLCVPHLTPNFGRWLVTWLSLARLAYMVFSSEVLHVPNTSFKNDLSVGVLVYICVNLIVYYLSEIGHYQGHLLRLDLISVLHARDTTPEILREKGLRLKKRMASTGLLFMTYTMACVGLFVLSF